MTSGGYILVVHLRRGSCIQVGKLGDFSFPAGYYLYFGSARSGVEARLARHFRQEKKLHWHIDYLLQRATPVEAWEASSEERLECQWAKAALGAPGARIVAPGFGSSDCRCPAHLVRFGYRPELEDFRTLLGAGGDGLMLSPVSRASSARESPKMAVTVMADATHQGQTEPMVKMER